MNKYELALVVNAKIEDEARAEKAEAKKAAKKAKVAEEAPVMSTPIEKTTLGDISALAALKEKLAKEGK